MKHHARGKQNLATSRAHTARFFDEWRTYHSDWVAARGRLFRGEANPQRAIKDAAELIVRPYANALGWLLTGKPFGAVENEHPSKTEAHDEPECECSRGGSASGYFDAHDDWVASWINVMESYVDGCHEIAGHMCSDPDYTHTNVCKDLVCLGMSACSTLMGCSLDKASLDFDNFAEMAGPETFEVSDLGGFVPRAAGDFVLNHNTSIKIPEGHVQVRSTAPTEVVVTFVNLGPSIDPVTHQMKEGLQSTLLDGTYEGSIVISGSGATLPVRARRTSCAKC